MSGPFAVIVNEQDVSLDVNGRNQVLGVRGSDTFKSLSPSAAGVFDALLYDGEATYGFLNTDSPLYGLLPKGSKIKWKTVGASGGGLQQEESSGGIELEESSDVIELEGTGGLTICTTILDDKPQDSTPGKWSVRIPGIGTLSRLRKTRVSTPLYSNITTSEALHILLDACGWPADERLIADGQTVLEWFWVSQDADPYDVMEKIRGAEGVWAKVYENTDGWFVFENRDYRTTATRCTTSQAIFALNDALTINPGFKDVIKGASLVIHKRTPGPLDVIWKHETDIVMAANEVITRKIRTRDPFINAVLPSAVGVNAIQFVKSDVPLTSGTVKLGYKGTLTVDLDWDATDGDVKAALETITGADTISVVGVSFTDGFFIYFEGLLKWQPIELLTVQSSLNPTSVMAMIDVIAEDPLTSTQTLVANPKPLNIGSFAIQYGAHITGPIAYNAPANAGTGNIQGILRALGPGVFPGTSVTVNGSGDISTDNMSIAIDESTAPEGLQPLSIVNASTLMASGQAGATLNVTHHQIGNKPDYVSDFPVTFSLSRTSGTLAILTITAGTSGATITGSEPNVGLKVRAESVAITSEHEISYPENLDDVDPAAEGRIEPLNIWPCVSREQVASQPQMVVEHYQEPRPTVSVKIRTPMRIADIEALVGLEISTRVTVVDTHTRLHHDFFIERVSPVLLGRNFSMEFGCEMVDSDTGVSFHG